MKNKEYWQKRFEQIQIAQVNKGVDYYNTLDKEFKKAFSSIQSDIERWYLRFADSEGITLQEARKRLNNKELEEFRWTVEEYIEKGKTLKYSDEFAKQLENASSRVHISRLEALKMQLQQQVEELYGNMTDGLETALQSSYEYGFYHTCFELEKGIGLGIEINRINPRKLKTIISKPWTSDGLNFSERIWGKYRPQLVQTIHTELTQACIRGDNPKKLIDKLSKKFDVTKSQAGNLVMTENSYFSSLSTRDGYNEIGVEQYEILATLDTHTSELCFDGEDEIKTPSEIQKVFRRKYTGDLITITTSTGNKLKGTPKHPILTSRGWLTLDEINPSHHVVYSVIDDTFGITTKQTIDMPTKFSEFFNSFRNVVGIGININCSSTKQFDSNGTGGNCEVDIINTDRILRNDIKPVFNKHIKHGFFRRCHNSIKLFCRRMFLEAFFTKSVVISTPEIEIFRFSNIIEPCSTPSKSEDYFTRSNTVVKKFNSFSSVFQTIRSKFPSFVRRCKTMLFEKCSHSGCTNTILFGKLNCGRTVSVLEENIITKSREFTSNHYVYNLQTLDNLYLNSNIVVHNCQTLDGKTFPMNEYEPWVTAPPFHNFCRSTTCPHFDDEFTIDEKRIARNPDGSQYLVSSSMKYREWEGKMVNGDVKDTEPKQKAITINDYIDDCKSIDELNQLMSKQVYEKGAINDHVQFTYDSKMNLEAAKEQSKHFIALKNEYNTNTIYGFDSQPFDGSSGEAGVFKRVGKDTGGILRVSNLKTYRTTEKYNYKLSKNQRGRGGFDGTTLIDPENANISTLYHEFAHSFTCYSQRKVSKESEEFWKEMMKLKKDYSKNVTEETIISDYANSSVDEFMAEAFTQAKLYSDPSPYATKALEIIDKYYRKS